MKINICTLLAILLFYLPLNGRDTTHYIPYRNHFQFQTGIYYKNFLGDRYIEPQLSSSPYIVPFEDRQYDRFTKMPTFGFSAGILFTHIFKKKLGISTGVSIFLRKDVFENNADSVIKYGNPSSTRDIHNVLTYNYNYYNLEFPLMFQYSGKKVTFFAGCYMSLITYKKVNYTYVLYQHPNDPNWVTSNKIVSGFAMPFKIFPTLQVSYVKQIKKIKFSPYLALYYAYKNQNDFYIQIGISIPILKANNQNLN